MRRLRVHGDRARALVGRLVDFEPGRNAKNALLLASGALTVLLALVRIATEARFSLYLLLLLPTMVAAWYLGRRWGLAVACLAVGTWLGADLAAGGDLRSSVPWVNAGVRAIVFGLVASVFAALRKALRELDTLAHRDALTGLANRRLFDATLDSERERAERFGHPMSVVSIDLDGFKALNDRRGHAAGDAVLVDVGRWLCEEVRTVDRVARMGGDEFAILLPECGPDAARTLAGRLRAAWEKRAPYTDDAVGVSMGVVTFEPPLPSSDTMLLAADAAMYDAKREGKGTTCQRVFGG